MSKVIAASTVNKDLMITIPKEVRDRLRIDSKDLVAFEILDDGSMIFYKLEPKKKI